MYNLRKFESKDDISEFTDIVCIGRGNTLIKEFCARFGLESKIKAILNDNEREQKPFLLDDIEISVKDFNYIFSIIEEDIKDTVFVIVDDYYGEVFESLLSYNVTNDSLNYDLQNTLSHNLYYYESFADECELPYRERYKESKLENIIVFRSGPHQSQYVHGMDFSDNARALFEYMLDIDLNDSYELVWLVKEPSEFKRYQGYSNVMFLSYDWALDGTTEQMEYYYRVMCLAKYIFFTDAYGFARHCRPDQIRVQLWHGCGFKTRVNFTRCEHRYEFMPVISPLYKEIHKKIYGLRDDQVLITGYPKDDWLFNPVDRSLSELLDIAVTSKYIIWMPTFRETDKNLANLNEYSCGDETGLPIVNTYDELNRLNEHLKNMDVMLIVKLHPFQKRDRIDCDGYTHIYLLENEELNLLDMPVNRILGKADALISDYSSAAVDYMLLDRPIGFLVEDVDKYGKSRGFVFEPLTEYLPGVEIGSFDDLVRFISDVSAGKDASENKRHKLLELMHTYKDDKSCERLVKTLGIK